MPIRKKENSKVVKSKSVSRADQQNGDKRRASSKNVKSKKTGTNTKLRDGKPTTFITKTKTDKSLFEEKLNKANALLSKASLLNKRAAATG